MQNSSVQSCQLPFVANCEPEKIGVSHLPMAYNRILERLNGLAKSDAVTPKTMGRMRQGCAQQLNCLCG